MSEDEAAMADHVKAIGRVKVREWRPAHPTRLVVLVHGYTEHGGRYAPLARVLAERGSLVVAPDHVGHGLSGGDRAVMADFESIVDDIQAVIEAYGDGLDVVLIGHSMGGLIAMRYAQRYPQHLAGLVLSAPAVGLAPFLTTVLALPEIPEQGFDGSLLSRDPAVGEDNAADPLVWHGPWQRATLEGALAANRAVDAGPGFGELPLLYLHGTDDQIVALEPARAVVERVAGPQSEFHMLPDQRHEIFNEIGKEETFSIVAGFVERVTGTGG